MSSGKTGFSLLLFAYVWVLLLPLAAFGQTATASQKLYGTWYPYHLGNPYTDGLRYEFRNNAATASDEMTVSRACPGDGRAVIAKVSSPVEITEDAIHVLKAASDTEPAQGNNVCQISVQIATLSYSLSEDGTRITITNPGGSPDIIELTRENPDSGPTSSQPLYGTWMSPTLNTKEIQVQTRFVFYSTVEHQDKLRQISICTKGTDTVVSNVDANVTIDKDRITILQTVSHQQPARTFICTSSLAAGTWRYTLAPGAVAMNVSIDGSKPIKLTRQAVGGLN